MDLNIKQELAIVSMQKDLEYMCKDMHQMHKESTEGITEIKKLLDKNDESHRAILNRLDNQLSSQNGRIKMYSEEFNGKIYKVESELNTMKIAQAVGYTKLALVISGLSIGAVLLVERIWDFIFKR